MSDSKFDFDDFIQNDIEDFDMASSKPTNKQYDIHSENEDSDVSNNDENNNDDKLEQRKSNEGDIQFDHDPLGKERYEDEFRETSTNNQNFNDSDFSEGNVDDTKEDNLNDYTEERNISDDDSHMNNSQSQSYVKSPPQSRQSGRLDSRRSDRKVYESPPQSRQSGRFDSRRSDRKVNESPPQSRQSGRLDSRKSDRKVNESSPQSFGKNYSRKNTQSKSPEQLHRQGGRSESPSHQISRSQSPIGEDSPRSLSPSPRQNYTSEESDKEQEVISQSSPAERSTSQSKNDKKDGMFSEYYDNSKKNRSVSYGSSEREDNFDNDSPKVPRQQAKQKETTTSSTKRSKSQPAPHRPPNGPPPRRYSHQPKKGRGGKSGRGGGNHTMSRSNEEKSEVVNRMLSANRNKSRALHNVITELQQQIEALSIENKDLRRAARLQDRELRKLDNAEAELPSLLKKHSSEMRVLQERFRKQKEQADKSREDLKKREHELHKTKEKLRKYEGLAKEKNLAERISLSKKIQEMQEALEEKDNKISELARSVQLHEKVRARELKEKNEKYRRAVEEMKRLEQEQKELLRKLRDKEKALEVTNIYSQRMNQRRGSKETEGTNFLFSPRDPVAPAIRRHQEEQQVEYAQSVLTRSIKKRQNTEKDTVTSERHHGMMETIDFEGDDSFQSSTKNKRPQRSVKESHNSSYSSPRTSDISHDAPKSVKTLVSEAKFNGNGDDANDEYEKKKNEDEKRLKELDYKIAEMKLREEMERKEAEIRKLEAEKELEERLKRMEAERLKRETEDLKKRDEEELQRIAKAKQHEETEQNRKLKKQLEEEEFALAEEDRQKFKKESAAQREEEEFEKKKQEMLEKRKKKELLLAKMQAIDRGENPEHISKPENHPKKRPIFLEEDVAPKSNYTNKDVPDRSNDQLKHNPSKRNRGNDEYFLNSNNERRNSWEFKKTDENLHRGLPAYSNDNSSTLSRRSTKDSDGMMSSSSSGRNRSSENGNSTDRTGRQREEFDDNSDIGYSPSGLKTQPVSKYKTKKTDDLFGAFDDPFKTKPKSINKKNDPFAEYEDPFASKQITNKNKNNIIFSSDEEDDVVNIPKYQPNRSSHNNKHTNLPNREFKGTNNFNKNRSARSTHGFDDLEEMAL